MGMSCLLTERVSGYNRVPFPPAKTIPFMRYRRLNILQDNALG